MKQTSRKKVLLSSVAMMMVATVSLGSATFAWFTSSTSAKATGIGVQTTKSSELKVAKKDLVWGDTVDYAAAGKTLRPVTSADGENWYSSVAAAKTDATSNGTYTPQTGAALADYAVIDMLNIKNAGSADCSEVTINITADMPSAFARLAVVECTEQTVANTMPSAATNFATSIYGTAKDDAWKPYNGQALSTTDYKTINAANGATISVGTLGANEVASYKVIVWFEGEDSDCYDTTTASFTAPNIEFSVTGKTV